MHLQVTLFQACLKLGPDGFRFLLGPAVYQPVIRIPTPREVRICPPHPEIECVMHVQDLDVRIGLITPPCGVPRARSILTRFCSMGALNHLPMYSRAHLHFTCFRTALSKSSCSMLSNRPLMSNSKTQSYFQHRLRVTPTASRADFTRETVQVDEKAVPFFKTGKELRGRRWDEAPHLTISASHFVALGAQRNRSSVGDY